MLINPCLDTLSKKTQNIANIKKNTLFYGKKLKNYLKNPNDIDKLHPDFLEE